MLKIKKNTLIKLRAFFFAATGVTYQIGEIFGCGNKLASLEAAIVRNYDPLTHRVTDKGEV